jgi:hypothetical protein
MKQRSAFSSGKGEPQGNRTAWFRGQYVPILGAGTRKDMLGTESWVARGTIQRIGASIFAVVLFSSSVALFVASLFVRQEILAYAGGTLGQIVGFALTVLALVGASLVMFLAFRIVRGIVRSFQRIA